MASFADKYVIPVHLAAAFTPQETEELKANFGKFDANSDGFIDGKELATILGLLGEKASPDAIDALLADADGNGDNKISFGAFVKMMHKNKQSGVQSQLNSAIKKASGVVRTTGAGGASHTFSEEEKHAFAMHINQCLTGDELMAKHLPLDIENDDLFTKGTDGILFCKLINCAVPDTIDTRAINKKENLSVYQKIENLNLALNAAKSIGCQIVNIGAQDLLEGRPILVLGILWQIIKIQLLSKISLKNHPEIVLLLEPGEELLAFMKLPPEDILMRWVNYHLNKANSSRRMTNFSGDIKDCEIYSILTNQLSPSQCSPATETNMTEKASHIIRNADAIGANPFIAAKDILDGNKKLNLGFVAQLFNTCHGLYISETEQAEFDLSSLEIDDIGDSREERVFRMWMNSLNIEDLYINDLFSDIQDGVNLLKVYDKVVPECINWKKVNMKPTSIYKKVENCNYCVQVARDDFKFSMVNIGGTDICNANKKLVLAIIWQLMRKYTLSVLAELASTQGISTANFNDDNVVQWANNKVKASGKNMAMKSLRDPSLSDSLFFINLVHSIEPRAVDWDLVIKEPSTEDDKMQNAKYVISCARKLGACVFLTPEDICEVKQKMLLTFVAATWVAELNRAATVTSVTPSADALKSAFAAAVAAKEAEDAEKEAKTPKGKYNKDGTLATGGMLGVVTPNFKVNKTPTSGSASKYNKDGTPVAGAVRRESKWGTPGVTK